MAELLLTNVGGVVALPQTGSNGLAVNIPVPFGMTIGNSQLVLRLLFTGGQSNGVDLQFQLDNIQIDGTVPEPATVAGGLLGVLGLCWFQRRRLIRSRAFTARVARIFCWGARASGAVAFTASRRNDLSLDSLFARKCEDRQQSSRSRGRGRQHARRARSPECFDRVCVASAVTP